MLYDVGDKGKEILVVLSEKAVEADGVDVMVMQLVGVRMVNDGMTTVVLVFEEDVLRLICGYAPQSG